MILSIRRLRMILSEYKSDRKLRLLRKTRLKTLSQGIYDYVREMNGKFQGVTCQLAKQ